MRVLKIFKQPVDINKLKKTRIFVESKIGQYLPKLYEFFSQGTIEEYCRDNIRTISQLNIVQKIAYAKFFLGSIVKFCPIDPDPTNFAVPNGKLMYLDWDWIPSDQINPSKLESTLACLLSRVLDFIYLSLTEEIRTLETYSGIRRLQSFYRKNLLERIQSISKYST